MSSTSCRRHRFIPLLLFALGALALPRAAGAQEPPVCIISGGETACGTQELCAPEGPYTYYWAPPNGGVQTTRCITATESGIYSLRVFDASGFGSEPCFTKFEIQTSPECFIKGPETTCEGVPVELCGPDSMEYAWSGPGGFTDTTKCVRVSAGGTYTLTVTAPGTKCTSQCSHKLETVQCITNCPRTPGFWGEQCLQKQNGSTKFTVAQVTQIAQCVDARSDLFTWTNPFKQFCGTINVSKMDERKQARRHFASLLANICTDQLNLIANNGNEIILSLDTRVTCSGVERTIGELVEDVDQRLIDLQLANLNNPAVKAAYNQIIQCLDRINNGIGIGPVCPEILIPIAPTGHLGDSREETLGSMPSVEVGAVELYRPYPNPFTGTTRMFFAVAAGGANVRIGVYDIAGRMVKGLANGFMPAGRHETGWDGTAEDGTRARAGMYFIRGSIGGQLIGTRIMYLK